ncbi:Ig-like domain-containing protein [Tenacibaculum finnmarkense genomovar finnmarkense]|nr:Ig-like domain-containing protein [Tenacibaculum finnmarkense]MCG8185568.1 Ig-like domain-containing protein [Tenacibaculum finnmarkense genomovar finnmarkense]MCG8202116.1 Ig-like domain-containing protein [Tenacibaculum finnmarkense genomovar finnmarkense]MCG8209596.1 Ig-like domain-containing protein [Tenacibaculum finnmarkense genomovar finnmarkense]MCG8212394.1 Ig-like domain-containing protein [Tenacibaculum finnmarkense genomovar finnmarkense]MCG8220760.1 Ig-like domain-containing pr
MPEGGSKDEDAPIMMTAKPPYKTIHFDKKNIKIEFDEYVVLKGLSKQLVVSPPLKYPPIITPQGTASKYINIEILDTLKTNTTYTFNFGNAVQDNNENNKLESFKYVFSTGNYIDSLKLKGSVAPAFTQKKLKNISVLLYRLDSTYTDSIIYKQKPNYLSSTLDSTNFEFTNLRKGKYLLLALKEASSDYIFNSKTDEIGFYKDTISLPRDTLVLNPITLFKEVQPYRFKRGKEVSKGKIQFGYEGKRGNMKIELVSKVPASFKSFSAYEKDKDTLNYWFTPVKQDSLNFSISNKNFSDTITVRLRKKQIDSLAILSEVKSVLPLKDTLFLSTNNPITIFDKSKFSLVDKDTVAIPFQVKKQRINKLAILFEKTPSTFYKLAVLPKGIIDVYETSNDTLKYQFKTLTVEDYGSIILEVKKQTKHPVIIQLLDKGEVVKTKYISSPEKVIFDLLAPKEYTVRAIIDTNNNNIWDTGNFLSKQQPEKVIYLEKVFKLRANWEMNEAFVIK